MVTREWLLAVVVVAAGIAALTVRRRQVAVPLWSALLIAVVVRVLVAVIARPLTPADVAFTFDSTARAIERGLDPALGLRQYQWNFLPVMPIVWAQLHRLGLPWLDVVRIPPIACDAVNVWLVGLLAVRNRATSRLVYALHPVAIMVAALHAQVEPVALSALLGGLLLLKRERQWAAGALFGLAIAVKTWPAVVVLAILAPRVKRSTAAVLTTILVPASFFLLSIAWLHSPPADLARALVSYRSYVGYWGWAGTIVAFGGDSALGYDSSVANVSAVLTVAAIVGALWLFHSTRALTRSWTVLLAMLIASAGFASQYLAWPIPFLVADDRDHTWFGAFATGFLLVGYLPVFPGDSMIGRVSGDAARQPVLAGLSLLVIATMVQLLWRGYRQRDTLAAEVPAAAGA